MRHSRRSLYRYPVADGLAEVAPLARLERAAYGLGNRRSILLSYRGEAFFPTCLVTRASARWSAAYHR